VYALSSFLYGRFAKSFFGRFAPLEKDGNPAFRAVSPTSFFRRKGGEPLARFPCDPSVRPPSLRVMGRVGLRPPRWCQDRQGRPSEGVGWFFRVTGRPAPQHRSRRLAGGFGGVAEPSIPIAPQGAATGAGRERLPRRGTRPKARTSIPEELCSEYTSLLCT
jgi:hypothetical protein